MKEITIKTKFDLGQSAVAFNSSTNKLQDIEISSISFNTDGITSNIWYIDKATSKLFMEKDVYTSREEFIEQL